VGIVITAECASYSGFCRLARTIRGAAPSRNSVAAADVGYSFESEQRSRGGLQPGPWWSNDTVIAVAPKALASEPMGLICFSSCGSSRHPRLTCCEIRKTWIAGTGRHDAFLLHPRKSRLPISTPLWAGCRGGAVEVEFGKAKALRIAGLSVMVLLDPAGKVHPASAPSNCALNISHSRWFREPLLQLLKSLSVSGWRAHRYASAARSPCGEIAGELDRRDSGSMSGKTRAGATRRAECSSPRSALAVVRSRKGC